MAWLKLLSVIPVELTLNQVAEPNAVSLLIVTSLIHAVEGLIYELVGTLNHRMLCCLGLT